MPCLWLQAKPRHAVILRVLIESLFWDDSDNGGGGGAQGYVFQLFAMSLQNIVTMAAVLPSMQPQIEPAVVASGPPSVREFRCPSCVKVLTSLPRQYQHFFSKHVADGYA